MLTACQSGKLVLLWCIGYWLYPLWVVYNCDPSAGRLFKAKTCKDLIKNENSLP